MATFRTTPAEHAYELRRRPPVERRLPPHQDDAERWAEFCQTIEDRIRAVRLDSGPPVCPTCGTHTPLADENSRYCTGCHETKPITAYALNRAQSRGRDYVCKACRRAATARRYEERKRTLIRETFGRAS